MHKIDSVTPPNTKTLESIANDLLVYRRFLDDTEIDYLSFPKRKLRRPTYRYRIWLQTRMTQGEISPNTASRRMSSVIGFYRWLKNQYDTDFKYPLWQESEISISFQSSYGLNKYKAIKTTDLSVHVPKNREDYSEYIMDSGKLRPLEKTEQLSLITALINIGNPEMTLAFLIALTTGARLQTVFTLRLKNLQTTSVNDVSEISICVGGGTGVDTKYQKRMILYVPFWLNERLCIYSQSERSQKRRDISAHEFENTNDQYIFLTRMGTPYYIADNDPLITHYRNPPRGASVRQFIKSQLKVELLKLDSSFEFSFHDLRATFGINLLEEKLSLINDETKIFDVLMLIKTRMGHCKLSTTEHYLNYRKKFKLAIHIQSEFEQYLMELIQGGKIDE